MAKYDLRSEFISTNVEGIQSIPKEWHIKQVRYLLKDGAEGIKIGPFGSALKLEDMVDDGFSVYGQENVIKKDFSLGKRKISETKFQEMSVYRIFPQDILITMMGTSGKCEIVPSDINDGIIDSHLLRVRVKENQILPEFFKLLIDKSPEISYQIQVFGKGSIMHGLNSGIVKSLNLPLPSIEEQKLILNFLDHETAKIDSLIAKQEKLIELLKEKRQAVISHAVTKGLNPDVNMKDSGVEWLGQVPEHWEILKFDYAINTVSDIDHYMPNSVDEGIPYVMTGDLQDVVSEIDFESCKKVAYSDYQKLSRKIKTTKDDIIFARYATIGTLSYVDIDKEFLVSYSCVTIKSNPLRTTGKYLSYYLKSQAFLQAIQQQINSNTQGNVGVDSLRNVKIILPLLSEQDAIIDFLKVELSKMDNLIDKAQSAIQLMQERRTALISSAVTGKIDVTNWQNPNHNNNQANTELGA
ncbi:restriction endonuclease subunit S [Acinetobacter sp. Ver3]|uniref:restriction endonuclease subunit S n=1 Tax=Acinetobacter sp. Ver3 TaxID=466088 RepID=UPI00045130D9|nr:restriction endonuclease subunit S [Acinetobacter sp. Ver3]EZQ04773.1 putative type I restriction-modification system specificity determinant [Acinetobacter sp. Ver3]